MQEGGTAALTALLTTSLVVASGSAAVAQEDDATDPATVVVTTEVLGAIVTDLVGDAAEVIVLMEGGANPHTFEASARDAENVLRADLLVSNGLELEEGLLSLLEAAASEGAAWFEAAEHVQLRDRGRRRGGCGSRPRPTTPRMPTTTTPTTPLIRTSGPTPWPCAMSSRPWALPSPRSASTSALVEAALVARLEALDAEVAAILSVVPDDGRKLVTGHRSMGYFADRYGFEQIGTVIPSLSTSGEPTARELAQLISDIRANDVTTVFAEVGTPQSVARAVADDSGATLVELSAVKLPEDGTYTTFIVDLATTIADALGS